MGSSRELSKAQAAERLPVGSVFGRRYLLQRALGSGGMGDVYLVTDRMLADEQVALKILRSDLSIEDRHVKRFLREVQLTRKVTHPNVVRTFDVGRENDQLFFTMEFVEGESLKEMIARGDTPVVRTIEIVRSILQGLSAIHQTEIIHRDLKPSNIIVASSGLIKIADFGVARPGSSDLTSQNEVIGSYPYMAPESWTGRDVGPASDIYALGVIWYELITGVLPFGGETPAEVMCKHMELVPTPPIELRTDVPGWVSSLIMKMLEKDPAHRLVSADAVLAQLQRAAISNAEGSVRSSGYVDMDLASAVGFEDEGTLRDQSLDLVSWSDMPAISEPEAFSSSVMMNAELNSKPRPVAFGQFGGRIEESPSPWSSIGGWAVTIIASTLVLVGLLVPMEQLLDRVWSAAVGQPSAVRTVQVVVLSVLFYALLFATPVLVVARLRAGTRGALISFVGMVVALALLFTSVGTFNVLHHVLRSKGQIKELNASRMLQLVEVTAHQVVEASLLAPYGTAPDRPELAPSVLAKPGILKVVPIESKWGGVVRRLSYYLMLFGYVMCLVSFTTSTGVSDKGRGSRRMIMILTPTAAAIVTVFGVAMHTATNTFPELAGVQSQELRVGITDVVINLPILSSAVISWMILLGIITLGVMHEERKVAANKNKNKKTTPL